VTTNPSPPAAITPQPAQATAATHPWHRWFARLWLDYLFAALILGVILGIAFPESSLLSNDYALMWVSAAFWTIAEAVFVASIGTTPGKYLVGIRIEKPGGQLLSLSEAFSRSFSAWAIGCAFLIPLISLFTLNAQYNRLRKGKPSTWDDKSGFVVIHTPLSTARALLLVLVVLGVLGLIVLGTMAARPQQ